MFNVVVRLHSSSYSQSKNSLIFLLKIHSKKKKTSIKPYNSSSIYPSRSSFPRANYEKPTIGPDGKRGKEGLIKKVERKWQEEVQQGADIKKGIVKHPSGWQKFKGGATRVSLITPSQNIQT